MTDNLNIPIIHLFDLLRAGIKSESGGLHVNNPFSRTREKKKKSNKKSMAMEVLNALSTHCTPPQYTHLDVLLKGDVCRAGMKEFGSEPFFVKKD